MALAQQFISSPTEEPERLALFSRLRRHKLVFCGIFLLSLAGMVTIYAFVPRTYESQTSIILAATEPVLSGGDPVVEQRRGDPADLQSQALVLRSLNLLQGVGSQPRIAALVTRECQARKAEPWARLKEIIKSTDCGIYEANKMAVAQYMQAYLGVSADGRSRVVNVTYSSLLPEAAELIPNAVVKAYLAGKLEDQHNSRAVAVDWLRSELRSRIAGSYCDRNAHRGVPP